MAGEDDRPRTTNRLLAGMATADLRLLNPYLRRQTIAVRRYLQKRGHLVEEAHFVESGIVSLLVAPRGHGPLEIGVIGQEGFTGSFSALIPGPSFHDSIVQVGGTSLAIAVDELRRAVDASPTLRDYLCRYLVTRMIQLGETTYANGRAKVQQRLARWLLMHQDRLCTTELPLTHESMSLMLGVRRASVTTALHGLEAEGWIRAQRGLVIVRDRAGLEQYCTPFYGRAEAAYEEIMGLPAGLPGCPDGETGPMPAEISAPAHAE